ncbi:hypothetical protein, partial [Intestinibacter bartlettii]|uniref:hypothetical protein n=1 Tax=Intestinibacter bartlettii TaxID=261299 RepID=UPI0039918171
MKDTAINLIISISTNYNYKEVEFIKKYMFKSEEDDKKLYNCFDFDIHRDTDKLFDLRLEFYEKYPDNIYYRLNFQRLFSKYDKKSIKIFELLLKNDRSKR